MIYRGAHKKEIWGNVQQEGVGGGGYRVPLRPLRIYRCIIKNGRMFLNEKNHIIFLSQKQ